MDKGACQAMVHGVTESQSDMTEVTKHTSGPVAKTLSSQCRGWGSIPGQELGPTSHN